MLQRLSSSSSHRLFLAASLSAILLHPNSAPAKEKESCAEAELKGREIFDVTQDRIFNGGLHAVILKTTRLTHETVLERGEKKAFSDYAHAAQFCFYQSDADASPEFCVDDVAYRVRGNRSRLRVKRQFKIKMNSAKDLFEGDLESWKGKVACAKQRRFYGLQSVTLRSGGPSSNDPTFLREPLATELVAAITSKEGEPMPVYRTSYVRFYVQYCATGKKSSCEAPVYKGLYYLTDEIDESLLEGYFGAPPNGALYETAYGRGDKKANFSFDHFAAPAYQPKEFDLSSAQLDEMKQNPEFKTGWTNCEAAFADRPDIYLPSGSIDVNATRKEFLPYLFMCSHVRQVEALSLKAEEPATANQLEDLFDIENLLQYMIAVNFTGHWDSLVGNANNDYLYFNPRLGGPHGGKWQIFIWDLDLTFGAMDGYQQSAGALQFRSITPSRLFTTVLDSPVLRDRYLRLYREKLKSLTVTRLETDVTRLSARVDAAVASTVEDDLAYRDSRAQDSIRKFVLARRQAVEASLNALLGPATEP